MRPPVARRKTKPKLTWKESDAKYIGRGRRKAIQYNSEWDDECGEMNENKRGRPFKFSHGMMAYIAITRVLLDISYRELQGFLEGSWGDKHETPEFTTIWKRIGKFMPRFKREDVSGTVKGRVLRRLTPPDWPCTTGESGYVNGGTSRGAKAAPDDKPGH